MFLPGFGTQSIHHYKNVALPDTLLWWPALWWYWRAFFGRRTSMGGKNSITFFQSSHPPNKCIFVLVKGAPNLSLQSGKKKKNQLYGTRRHRWSLHAVFSSDKVHGLFMLDTHWHLSQTWPSLLDRWVSDVRHEMMEDLVKEKSLINLFKSSE